MTRSSKNLKTYLDSTFASRVCNIRTKIARPATLFVEGIVGYCDPPKMEESPCRRSFSKTYYLNFEEARQTKCAKMEDAMCKTWMDDATFQ